MSVTVSTTYQYIPDGTDVGMEAHEPVFSNTYEKIEKSCLKGIWDKFRKRSELTWIAFGKMRICQFLFKDKNTNDLKYYTYQKHFHSDRVYQKFYYCSLGQRELEESLSTF